MSTRRTTGDRWTAANVPDQRGRTVVVTGANTGLGFETADDQRGGPPSNPTDPRCCPRDLGLPFSTFRLSKLAQHVVAAGVIASISRESIRQILRAGGLSWQATTTWKTSNDQTPSPRCAVCWAFMITRQRGGRSRVRARESFFLEGGDNRFQDAGTVALGVSAQRPAPQEAGWVLRVLGRAPGLVRVWRAWPALSSVSMAIADLDKRDTRPV